MLLIPLLLSMSAVVYSVPFWKCDFEMGNCHAKSTTRMQRNYQLTKHWNVWQYGTPTGSTIQGQTTGPSPHYTGKYLYFESTPGPMDKSGISEGSVAFKNVSTLGRLNMMLTFKYLAFGNEADLLDLDVHVMDGGMIDKHMDANEISKHQNDWKYFKWHIKADSNTKYLDIKIKARTGGKLGDYAIDDLKLEEYGTPVTCTSNCGSGEWCTATQGVGVCLPSCINVVDCPGMNTECLTSDARHLCKCKSGFAPQFDDPYATLNCYTGDGATPATQLIPLPYHPSLWLEPFTPLGLSYEEEIYGANEETGAVYNFNNPKLSFFYIFNDNYKYIKDASILISGERFPIYIHRDHPNKWTLFEHTGSSGGSAIISITLHAVGVDFRIAKFSSTPLGEDIVNKKFNGIMCDTLYSGIDYHNPMIIVTALGYRECVCKPNQKKIIKDNKYLCKASSSSDVITQAVCDSNNNCEGDNTVCVNSRCVCMSGHFSSSGNELLRNHSCASYPCNNSPCQSNQYCVTTGQTSSCQCPSDFPFDTLSGDCVKSEIVAQCSLNPTCTNVQIDDLIFSIVPGGQEFPIPTYNMVGDCSSVDALFAGGCWKSLSLTSYLNLNVVLFSNSFHITGSAAGSIACSIALQGSGEISVIDNSNTTLYNSNFTLPSAANHPINFNSNGDFRIKIRDDTAPYGADEVIIGQSSCSLITPAPFVSTPTCNPPCASPATCVYTAVATAQCVCPDQSSYPCAELPLPRITVSGESGSCLGDDCLSYNQMCTADNKCICQEGYVLGEDGNCTVDTQCGSSDCSGKGFCDKGQCICEPGYSGNDCSSPGGICGGACAHLSPNGYCNSPSGKCLCNPGFVLSMRDDGKWYCDADGVVETEESTYCSVSCGDGMRTQKKVCTPPVGSGNPCDLTGSTGNVTCTLPACPMLSSCSVPKNCDLCQNEYDTFDSNGLPHVGFNVDSVTKDIFMYLSKWNNDELNKKCREAQCDTDKLNFIKKCIQKDMAKMDAVNTAQAVEKLENVLDCVNVKADDEVSSNLWGLYDKVLELNMYIPYAKSELKMKEQLVMHEYDRCLSRSDLREIFDGMNSW